MDAKFVGKWQELEGIRNIRASHNKTATGFGLLSF